jgi:predicted ArsR family transcriptional regulator
MIGPTRQNILEYFLKYHTATSAELSEAFHFTKENIRHHLDILLREGLIEVLPETTINRSHPGRPSLVYHIHLENQPGNMIQLGIVLFRAYLENLKSDHEKEAKLKKLAKILFPTSGKDKKPTQLYNQSIEQLNQHGYQARWEAHHEGPLFSFRNCPYAAAQMEQPELCQMDSFILENLLGSPVSQVTKMNFKGKNPPSCIFSLDILKT